MQKCAVFPNIRAASPKCCTRIWHVVGGSLLVLLAIEKHPVGLVPRGRVNCHRPKITLESVKEIFQGITTLFEVSPHLAVARLGLIALGFLLIFLGRKGVLEALIMIPMGLGMATINAAVMFFNPLDPINTAKRVGNLLVEPQAGLTANAVQNAADLMTILQIDWLQPIYTFTLIC